MIKEEHDMSEAKLYSEGKYVGSIFDGPKELAKLAEYLRENKYPFIENCIPFFDEDGVLITGQFNQIIVFDRVRWNMHGHDPYDDIGGARVSWDAICYRGTYGYKDGLLEVMGDIVGEGVEGWLSADDVIDLLQSRPSDDTEHEFVNRDP